jgi:TRAP-type C4-dicarboxylate transport system substrate-binding protein
MTTTADSAALKQLVKTAILEVFDEHRELLCDVVAEALEDVALARAIEQGMETPEATREEVFDALNRVG